MSRRSVGGVLPQDVQRDDSEGGLMGGGQADLGGGAFVMRLQEAGGAEAPLVAGFQARKAVFWARVAGVNKNFTGS